MPPTLQESLTTLAHGFSIAQTPAASARELTVQLISPNRRFQIDEDVTTTELVAAALDLSWRTKDVRFVNTDILDPATNGGMPITDLLTLNVGTVTNGAPSPAGVPGLIGLLNGTVPIPMEVTNQVTHTFGVEVRWRIRDEASTIVSDVNWTLANSPAITGVGGEITPPLGRAMDVLGVVFPVIFVDLTANPTPVGKRFIEASIRLSAGGTSTGWVKLPRIEVLLPVIPVPTVLVLFQYTNFEGLVLIVVPASSPLERSTMNLAFDNLIAAIDPLDETLTVLSFIIGELQKIDTLIDGATVTFRKADQIPDLDNIDLETDWWNTEAEDELSSLIFVGPPRRQVQCFNEKSYSDSQGQMNVTIGQELFAESGTLHSASPASDPMGRISVPRTPDGTRWAGIWRRDITTFGDELSSLRFGWE